jgi:hypothetical protein
MENKTVTVVLFYVGFVNVLEVVLVISMLNNTIQIYHSVYYIHLLDTIIGLVYMVVLGGLEFVLQL